MADRRSEESSVAPRRTLAGPGETGADARGAAGGKGRRPDPRLDDTVATAPVRDEEARKEDTSERSPRSSGAERFAAAISTAREKSSARVGRDRGTDSGAPRKVRKAHLRVAHVDPWSVMKSAFLLSIAIGIVLVVAVMVIWSVLGATGVWDSINRAVTDVVGNETSGSFDIQDYLGMSRVMGFTMIVAVVDVVLLTVIATLGAFLYNLAAVLLGGVEVTLAEDERPAAGTPSNGG